MSLNVSQESFVEIWERVEPWLIHALEHSGSVDSIIDVRQAVREGKCQLFVHESGAAVTMVDDTARVPTLQVWLMGGDMKAAEEMLPDFEMMAGMLGCKKLSLLGRTGWQKTFLTKVGFKITAVVMEKTLREPPKIEVVDGQG